MHSPLVATAPPEMQLKTNKSVHLSDELVDVFLPVSKVTSLDEVLELSCSPATGGVGELKWPQEVRRLAGIR